MLGEWVLFTAIFILRYIPLSDQSWCSTLPRAALNILEQKVYFQLFQHYFELIIHNEYDCVCRHAARFWLNHDLCLCDAESKTNKFLLTLSLTKLKPPRHCIIKKKKKKGAGADKKRNWTHFCDLCDYSNLRLLPLQNNCTRTETHSSASSWESQDCALKMAEAMPHAGQQEQRHSSLCE